MRAARVRDSRSRAGTARLTLDDALDVEVLRGSQCPIGGWVSRGYHRRAPATTLVGRTRSRGPRTLVCSLALHQSAPQTGTL